MSRGRLVLICGPAFLAACVAAGLLWWRAGKEQPPEPPTLPGEKEDEPALTSLVEQTRRQVLHQPRSAPAWGRLGEVFLANGYHHQAIFCFEQAARLGPSEARWPYLQGLAQRQNSIDAACLCFQKAAGLAQEKGPRTFAIRLRCAEALLRTGKGEEARPLLESLVQEDPENARVHLALSLLALSCESWDEALAHLLRCADSPVTRQRAAAQLSRVYLQKGDVAAAERSRSRARRLPHDAEGEDPFVEDYAPLMVSRPALLLRADLFLRAHQTREAIDVLQALVADYPNAAEPHIKLGMAQAEMGDYAQAEAALRRGLALAADNVDGHYFLCVALFHQAERTGSRSGFEAALEEARQTVRCKPDHAYGHLYLGLTLRKLGSLQDALQELRQAVRFAPESTDPHLHLGEALLAAGQREEGLAQLEKAVEVADVEDQRPQQVLNKWQRSAEKGRS